MGVLTTIHTGFDMVVGWSGRNKYDVQFGIQYNSMERQVRERIPCYRCELSTKDLDRRCIVRCLVFKLFYDGSYLFAITNNVYGYVASTINECKPVLYKHESWKQGRNFSWRIQQFLY